MIRLYNNFWLYWKSVTLYCRNSVFLVLVHLLLPLRYSSHSCLQHTHWYQWFRLHRRKLTFALFSRCFSAKQTPNRKCTGLLFLHLKTNSLRNTCANTIQAHSHTARCWWNHRCTTATPAKIACTDSCKCTQCLTHHRHKMYNNTHHIPNK